MVDGVVGESADGGEVLLEGGDVVGEVGGGIAMSCRLRLMMSPLDVVDTGLLENLLGGVGVGSRVEEQDRELRGAAGGEIERILSGDEQDAFVGGDLGVGDADELFEVGDVGAGGGEAS